MDLVVVLVVVEVVIFEIPNNHKLIGQCNTKQTINIDIVNINVSVIQG